ALPIFRALRGPAVLDMHPENDVPVIVQEEVAVVLKTVLDLVHVVIEMVFVAVTAVARLTNTHVKVVLPGIVTDPQRLTRVSGHSTAGPADRVQLENVRGRAELGRHGEPKSPPTDPIHGQSHRVTRRDRHTHGIRTSDDLPLGLDVRPVTRVI